MSVSIEYKKDRDIPEWKIGFITLGKYIYKFEAKVFEEPSQFGIDNGCISKLYVKEHGKHEPMFVYERGWDIKPKTEIAKVLLSIIQTEFDA